MNPATNLTPVETDLESRPKRLPPAGPHDRPELTNPLATPGTGALPPPGPWDEVDSVTS